MATKKLPERAQRVSLVESVIQINPRGRSVVTGTLVEDGELQPFKHELSDSEKSEFIKLILSGWEHFPYKPL